MTPGGGGGDWLIKHNFLTERRNYPVDALRGTIWSDMLSWLGLDLFTAQECSLRIGFIKASFQLRGATIVINLILERAGGKNRSTGWYFRNGSTTAVP